MLVHAPQFINSQRGAFAELQEKYLQYRYVEIYWMISIFTTISKVRTCYTDQINTHACADWA